MLKIIEGKEQRPLKFVIYGPEGIGKTSLASQFPYPLFIDTEGGTSSINLRRIKCQKSWDELLSIVKEIHDNPHLCKTVVIDTADWAEILCENAVCEKYRKSNIEDFGFGKGYVYLVDEYSKLLAQLDRLLEVGINVVITAHAKPRKFELPEEAGAYDRYEMKLTKQVAPLLKEWCDALLFCNYKIYVVATESGSKKAQGGKRVMYTSHNPTYDAKNRFNLPDECELSFSALAHLFSEHKPNVGDTKPSVVQERQTVVKLKEMIMEAGINESDVHEVVGTRGHYEISVPISDYSDDFITRWIIPNWKKITETIKNKGDK